MRLPFQQQIGTKLHTAYALTRAGFLRPERPDRLARLLGILIRWGATPAAAAASSALRYPSEVGLIDDLGELTFREIHRRSNALANALSDRGVVEGDGIAILARNHRYIVEATIACSKLGAHALYLNTSFAAPQARDVLDREKPRVTIYDAEFAELIDEATKGRRTKRYVAWIGDGDAIGEDESLEDLVAGGDPEDVLPPDTDAKFIILTSGTTGTPKGASRSAPRGLDPVGGLFSRVPYRARETHFIVAPLFHAWGIGQYMIASALSATIVLQNRFSPEPTLEAIDEYRPTVLAVVPVMLSRILDLPQETRAHYDTSSLRIVFASGSALPGELGQRWMNAFGDNLYNLYGSTEVAWATIATPEDMRAAPGTAGKPPFGTIVKILDKDGRELPSGQTGRIFVGSELVFEGYTGGGSKETSAEGLMSTGDMGHLDDEGRLFIDSREDDMIVSGGENVYPGEVEELLSKHPKIADAAVIGVDDPDFGQRLKAFVVKSSTDLDEEEVKAYVKDHLARYKVPREVEFLDELPRNATGKVLKKELQEREEGEEGDDDGSKSNGKGSSKKSNGSKKKETAKKG
jgi:acyl-CoA synthetase (AMP-forming)/AMP-acid ligase II